jgi:hypothetical protein
VREEEARGRMLLTASVKALVSFRNFSVAVSRTAKFRWKSSNSGSVDSGGRGGYEHPGDTKNTRSCLLLDMPIFEVTANGVLMGLVHVQ